VSCCILDTVSPARVAESSPPLPFHFFLVQGIKAIRLFSSSAPRLSLLGLPLDLRTCFLPIMRESSAPFLLYAFFRSLFPSFFLAFLVRRLSSDETLPRARCLFTYDVPLLFPPCVGSFLLATSGLSFPSIACFLEDRWSSPPAAPLARDYAPCDFFLVSSLPGRSFFFSFFTKCCRDFFYSFSGCSLLYCSCAHCQQDLQALSSIVVLRDMSFPSLPPFGDLRPIVHGRALILPQSPSLRPKCYPFRNFSTRTSSFSWFHPFTAPASMPALRPPLARSELIPSK